MRNGFLIAVIIAGFAAEPAMAQDVEENEPPTQANSQPAESGPSPKIAPVEAGPPPKVVPVPSHAPTIVYENSAYGPAEGCCYEDCCGATSCGYECWGGLEYMLWWIDNGPNPVPLVTTGDPGARGQNPALAGALGQPTTRILYGGSSIDFGTFSGTRLTLGTWVDPCRVFGVEVSGFVLEQRSEEFAAQSDAAGRPGLYIPFFNTNPNFNGPRQDRLEVADPLNQFAGSVLVSSQTRLWGAEINGVMAAMSGCDCSMNFLVGFRYLDLQESLDIGNTTRDISGNDVTTSFVDHFGTRNQFYGGQVGAHVHFHRNCWTLDLKGKLAVGSTHQVVNIDGATVQSGADAFAPGQHLGGLFTQPSNIGRTVHGDFTVVPELEVKIGYEVSCNLGVFVGYDLLYWNQVVRPGNQIDRNVDLAQNPALSGTGQYAPGISPTSQFNRTDFWANGFSFGVTFKY